MSARNVNLTARLNTFIDEQVRKGRHQNASEVVREALRRYEDGLRVERDTEAIWDVISAAREAIARGDFASIAGLEGKEALLAWMARRALMPRSDDR